jgi:cyclic pyranopterin phosphate synthase
VVGIFTGYFDFNKIRFTGGEPLARRGFIEFLLGLKELKNHYGFSAGITTNGVLLADKLERLKSAGIDHFNISMDSLNGENFRRITGKNVLHKVLLAIFRANELSPGNVKVNCVVMKGVNDHELLSFADFAIKYNINVRFIEYMPFTNNGWNEEAFMSTRQMKKLIETKYKLDPLCGSTVSKDFNIEGTSGRIGFISSISEHFCDSCSRLRITARGGLRLCLFSEEKDELDMKGMLRQEKMDDTDIAAAIENFIKRKLEKHPEPDELVKLNYNYMLRSGG